IIELDPYLPEVMRFFKQKKYKRCKIQRPLTKVNFVEKTQKYQILIDQSVALKWYNGHSNFFCCYKTVFRASESKITYSPCLGFKSGDELPDIAEGIIVQCSTRNKRIYVNGHATVPVKEAVQKRLEEAANQDEQRPLSVLMLGIDSISRVNLIRAMPKTAQYLYDNGWFELAGYNKMDDNTYPNIMAMATGYDFMESVRACAPWTEGGLDKCNFVWKLFQQHGYATAFAEDASSINTFNYLKKGFQRPPTDYYLRPYMTAAEDNLEKTSEAGIPHCLGYKTAAEHVYDYATEFTRRFLNDTYFGFFWTNTHSHSDLSQTSAMDGYMVDYLKALVRQGTMENSVVVFFSDHGMRFGPTRLTWSGHMEERLPAMFFWLPERLRKAHPEFVHGLRVNKNRLTTPYDLHVTMKHLLSLSGRVTLEALGPAPHCPQCHSLFYPVPRERSCLDVGIEDHWCTCWEYDRVSSNSKVVRKMGRKVVSYLNNYVANFHNGTYAKICVPLRFQDITSAYMAQPNPRDPEEMRTYRLTFTTLPNKGYYESTLRFNQTDESIMLAGSVSRLNTYRGESNCVPDFAAKKYCYCRK
ncbi:hypothetical protein KR018_001822, partial [Drosophila ironensis]